MIQKDLFPKGSDFAKRKDHGGDLRSNKRKLGRPLDSKKPLHVVLKFTEAVGTRSFLWHVNDLFIDRTIEKYARKYRITIQRFENMGNHIHFLLKFKRRNEFQDFLRTVTAQIARFVTKARRGKPFGRRFWDALAFTRVVTGRRDYFGVINYFDKNHCEREYGAEARERIEADERRIRAEHRLRRSSKRNMIQPVPARKSHLGCAQPRTAHVNTEGVSTRP